MRCYGNLSITSKRLLEHFEDTALLCDSFHFSRRYAESAKNIDYKQYVHSVMCTHVAIYRIAEIKDSIDAMKEKAKWTHAYSTVMMEKNSQQALRLMVLAANTEEEIFKKTGHEYWLEQCIRTRSELVELSEHFGSDHMLPTLKIMNKHVRYLFEQRNDIYYGLMRFSCEEKLARILEKVDPIEAGKSYSFLADAARDLSPLTKDLSWFEKSFVFSDKCIASPAPAFTRAHTARYAALTAEKLYHNGRKKDPYWLEKKFDYLIQAAELFNKSGNLVQAEINYSDALESIEGISNNEISNYNQRIFLSAYELANLKKESEDKYLLFGKAGDNAKQEFIVSGDPVWAEKAYICFVSSAEGRSQYPKFAVSLLLAAQVSHQGYTLTGEKHLKEKALHCYQTFLGECPKKDSAEKLLAIAQDGLTVLIHNPFCNHF
jgi:hypothetical protein